MLNPICAAKKMKTRTGGEEGTASVTTRLVQKNTAEGKTFYYEWSWQVKVTIKINGVECFHSGIGDTDATTHETVSDRLENGGAIKREGTVDEKKMSPHHTGLDRVSEISSQERDTIRAIVAVAHVPSAAYTALRHEVRQFSLRTAHDGRSTSIYLPTPGTAAAQ